MKVHTKNLFTEVFKDMWVSKWLTLGYFLGLPASIIGSQAVPLVSSYIIDSAANGTLNDKWKFLALLSVALALVVFIFQITSRWCDQVLRRKYGMERRARFASQVHRLPYAALVDNAKGDLLAKANRKASYFHTFLYEFDGLLDIIISTIITVVIIFSRNYIFGLLYLFVFVPSSTLLIHIARKRIKVNKKSNEAFDKWGGVLTDSVQNSELIAQYSTYEHEHKSLTSVGRKLWKKGMIRAFFAVKQQAAVQFSGLLLESSFTVLGLYFFVNGNISIGTYVLFQSYVSLTMRNINNASHFIRNSSEETSLATSLDELEDKYPSVSEPVKPKKLKANRLSLQMKDVSFTYEDDHVSALENVSLEIPAGQKVGIVGKSGSGKSTLFKLILRLYDPTSGEILLSNVDIADLGSANARENISYVPQDPILFHRSIKENITYGIKRVSTDDLERSISQSHISEFLDSLPKGLDTVVGDRGVKLSGGQRQRVAIARAIIKDAPLLLFDEATSALDSESEAIIQKALKSVMKDKTAIVIAHRLSTLKHMDRIVVMDKGRIVEDGNHSQLINKKAIYYDLWSHQSDGFIE